MYKENSNNLIKNSILKNEEVFDFHYSPYKERFEKVYENINKILIKESNNYKIVNSTIVFGNDRSVNAKAGRINNHNVIIINSGTVIWLIENVIENNKLIKFIMTRSQKCNF